MCTDMQPASDPTRDRLLQAAERILLDHGASALTVRRIGAVAGLNGTLVTYHFGSMAQLEGELARRNLQPMETAWQQLEQVPDDIEAIVRAWLLPLLLPAAFHADGRALPVLDELAAHARKELREDMMRAMRAVAIRVTARLQPLLPDMTSATLAARLRFIAGAALGPPPRGQPSQIDGDQLVAFATAALVSSRS